MRGSPTLSPGLAVSTLAHLALIAALLMASAAGTGPQADPGPIAVRLASPSDLFAAEAAAKNNVHVHISLYEHQPMQDGRGLNVAIVVDPAGRIVARTPKLHIPVTAGYYEDQYFAQGPSDGEPYPVYEFDFDGTGIQ